MTYADRIRRKLTEGLAPTRLEVIDESGRHAGHAGADRQGETHFRVTVVAGAFEGRSRVDRHRLVHALLAEELAERVHALALRAISPGEGD
jgi:BolA protein